MRCRVCKASARTNGEPMLCNFPLLCYGETFLSFALLLKTGALYETCTRIERTLELLAENKQVFLCFFFFILGHEKQIPGNMIAILSNQRISHDSLLNTLDLQEIKKKKNRVTNLAAGTHCNAFSGAHLLASQECQHRFSFDSFLFTQHSV